MKSQNQMDASLDKLALQYLEKKGNTDVVQLHNELRVAHPTLTRAETTDAVWRLAKQGKIELEDQSHPAASFVQFLGRWERNLWFYTSLAVSIVTILTIYAIPANLPFNVLRLTFGLAFVLLIPGYMTTKALFLKGDFA